MEMTKVFMLIATLVVVALIALIMVGKASRTAPTLGIVDGRLLACPDKANCVCSEYREDAEHFIEAFDISVQSGESVTASVSAIIVELGGETRLDKDGYVAATFTSSLFGFVDDLEVRFDRDNSVLHFRSGSRVGYSDFGANRKRVELIRARW
jgi:uncharacterized protein (DUF1499 family)